MGDIREQDHLLDKDIQDRVMEEPHHLDRVMEEPRLLDKEVMEEEDIHLVDLELEWIPRSSSGSMLWIRTEVDK